MGTFHGWAKLPGRITVIGGHTGDNNGFAITAAIPLHLTVRIEQSSQGQLTLESDAFPDTLRIDSLQEVEESWAKYVVGALQTAGLSENEIRSLKVSVTSNLPMRKGLASSAALVAATLLAACPSIAAMPKTDLLELCRSVERTYVGVNCGIIDYYTNLFAVSNGLLMIDFRERTHQVIPWPSELAILVCDPGMPRQLVNSQFNLRRAQCETIARAAGKPSLREVSRADIGALRHLYPVEAKRADHVLDENERVIGFAEALRSRDLDCLSPIMAEAHDSLANKYECTSFEQDLLVHEARKMNCCVGSRLTGAGWGGSTIHLVRIGEEQELMHHLRKELRKATGLSLRVFVFRTTVNGALCALETKGAGQHHALV